MVGLQKILFLNNVALCPFFKKKNYLEDDLLLALKVLKNLLFKASSSIKVIYIAISCIYAPV